jgi:hypothetical protein
LAFLFDPLSALVDQEEVAQKQCPACAKTYAIQREVSVNYQVLAEANANYV